MAKKVEPNKIVVDGDLVYIHLSGKNGKGKVTKTDMKSFLKYDLGKYTWLGDGKHVEGDEKKQGYAIAWDSENKKQLSMHRVVSENNTRRHSDHRNGYTLDNRSLNLRICDAKQNNYNADARKDNKTGYKNVTEYRGTYRCMIKVEKIKEYFGSFDTPMMAGYAYNVAMGYIAPEHARLNEIPVGALTKEEMEHVEATVNRRIEKIFGKRKDEDMAV